VELGGPNVCVVLGLILHQKKCQRKEVWMEKGERERERLLSKNMYIKS
jgi:hypothetical protein